MTIYAELGNDNIVTNVIVATESSIQFLLGNFIKSDNTTGSPVIGAFYDNSLNKFIHPKPYPSWTLDNLGNWQAPIAKPSEEISSWDEETQQWIIITPVEIELNQ